MLYLIGLGLGWKDLSLKALEALSSCDAIFLDGYTSVSEFSVKQLERLIGRKIKVLNREAIEEKFEFLELVKNTALLVYGDVLAATTHFEILKEARKKKIEVKVIHSSSIFTAIAETGLSLYRFGKVASIPFWEKSFEPESFFDVLEENQSINAHTLFLLDLKPGENRFLTPKQAIELLLKISKKRVGSNSQEIGNVENSKFSPETLCIACSRLGMEGQIIKVGKAKEIAEFGKEPWCLIVPAKLNNFEQEALKCLI